MLLAELCMHGEFRIVPDRLFYRRRHSGSSCLANRSLHDRAVWFHPANRGHCVLPLYKHLVEHLKAVGRTEMAIGEKIRCIEVVFAHWAPRWRAVGGEFKRAVKWKLKLGPMP